MMQHVIEAFRAGTPPRETFEDGVLVNAILDAAYRSMKSGCLEPATIPQPTAVS
jgi:predicted dehydrogenase